MTTKETVQEWLEKTNRVDGQWQELINDFIEFGNFLSAPKVEPPEICDELFNRVVSMRCVREKGHTHMHHFEDISPEAGTASAPQHEEAAEIAEAIQGRTVFLRGKRTSANERTVLKYFAKQRRNSSDYHGLYRMSELQDEITRNSTLDAIKVTVSLRELVTFLESAAPSVAEKTKYIKWIKLFYGMIVEDFKGKPSAFLSALSEDGEFKQILKEIQEYEQSTKSSTTTR